MKARKDNIRIHHHRKSSQAHSLKNKKNHVWLHLKVRNRVAMFTIIDQDTIHYLLTVYIIGDQEKTSYVLALILNLPQMCTGSPFQKDILPPSCESVDRQKKMKSGKSTLFDPTLVGESRA